MASSNGRVTSRLGPLATRWLASCGLGAALVLLPFAARAQVTRLDVAPGGAPANGITALMPVVSFDGRYVAFASTASNLVPGDADATYDFFRHDAQTTQLIRGDFPAAVPSTVRLIVTAISHDGRWLLFNSPEAEWVAGDTNLAADAFQYDFTTGQVRRVSVGSGSVQAEGSSFALSMSADGRYVAFESTARNLGPAGLDNGTMTDVFVHDTLTAQTVQVSRGAGNLPADGFSGDAMMSPDGDWVVFSSGAGNLTGPPEPSPYYRLEVYLAHWRTGDITKIAPRGVVPDGPSWFGVPAWDATSVIFCSSAYNLAPGPTIWGDRDYVWDRMSGVVSDPTPLALVADYSCFPLALGISARGRYVTRTQPGPYWLPILVHHDRQDGRSVAVALGTFAFQMSHDGRVVVYGGQGSTPETPGVYRNDVGVSPDGLFPAGDADTDGLPNGWEEQFGLDPLVAALGDGPDGDPDGDAVTNAQELAAGTHPRGFHTRYLAEGASGSFFDTQIAIANPDTTSASVLLRMQRDDAITLSQPISLRPRGGRTIDADAVVGLSGHSFSTVIESDAAVVVDRTMAWDATGYGAHAETSIASPSTTWFLAEGATSGNFAVFYLMQNPQSTSAEATVRFLRPSGQPPITRTYVLPPGSRTTIAVDTVDPALASTDVSAAIVATVPIIVERAMYLNLPGQPFGAGHGSAGVTAPATSWFLAEGATGSFFDLFVLLANPGDQAATCEVRYLTSSGANYTKAYTLGPNSRTTIWVDQEEIPGVGRILADTAVSTTVTSTNGVPIVVERSMWWPGGAWYEAHNSPGATATGPRWAIAYGEAIGRWIAPASDVQTYILIANTSTASGDVRVTLFYDYGATVERTFIVGGSSRFNVSVRDEFPDYSGRFWALVEALGSTPVELVVERAMYWNANGVMWAAGTNELGTRVP